MSFGRLLTAMVTPMHQDGSVNYDVAADLARHLVSNGSDGLVLAGSTGESPTLSFDEKKQLFSVVKQAVGGTGVVLAGTGSNDTRDTAVLTAAAAEAGVDGVMLVVPYYNRPTQEGMYEHFKTVAGQTDLPIMVYNIPGRTGQNMLPETMARLVEAADNVVAIKESSGDLEQVSLVRRLTPPHFHVYAGDDALALPTLAVGGRGIISVVGHVAADRMQHMMDQFYDGNVSEAAALHLELLPLIKSMFITTNPIPVKAAMRLLGWDVGPVRLPLTDMTGDGMEQLRNALHAAGLTSGHLV